MNQKRPKYVHAKTSKGRTYYRFKRRGVSFPLPDIDAPEFWGAYAIALKGRVETAESKQTFSALIKAYKEDEAFTSKASRTRKDYEGVLIWIDKSLGDGLPADLDQKTVRRVRDGLKSRRRFANYTLQVLSILMEFACEKGWADANPAKGVKHIAKPKGEDDVNRPWSQAAREAFEAAAGPRERMLYELCIGTGQRFSDVLAMKWTDLKSGEIHVQQSKTGKALVIPLTGRLRRYLRQTPHTGVYMVAKNIREPMRKSTIDKALRKARAGTDAEGFTIHGLRYTAAEELALAGCSDDEIAAITGHTSVAMVAKYAGSARQRQRARIAQAKRDE